MRPHQRKITVSAYLFTAALAIGSILVATPAFANTTNPTSIQVTGAVNNDGTETVVVSGDWTWPAGQACVGRYGTGWAIGWWGIGSSATPTKNFALTNASEITSTGQGENGSSPTSGTANSTGSIRFPSGGVFPNQYFYVGTYYAGSEIFTPSFCDSAQPPNGTSKAAFSGTYTAVATYPSAADVPEQICVVTYDEHGKQGAPTSGSGGSLSNDFNPSKDGDNSIQSSPSQFAQTTNCAGVGGGTSVPVGSVGFIGLAFMTGGGLFYAQRRSRRRRADGTV